VVGYSAEDLKIWARLMGRCIRAAGARTGDIVHIAYDYGLFTGGLGSHAGAEHLGCTVIPVSSGRSAWQIELMEDFRPDILMATPSYALNLANAFEARGLDPHESSLRIGIFGAEPWSETTRAALQLRLGLEAFDLYGLAEVMGPGVACESAGGALGLTLWEDHVYPEVIDPSTGRVLPDGEEGELVLTSLTKEALPVIRYRTHDLTRLLPPQQGPMRRIARVSARTDDMLVIHGVNVFPSQIDALLARSGGFSPHYKLEISRSGPLDDLTVHAEILSRQYQSDAQLRAAADDLMQEIKTFIGVSVTVVVHRAGTIERAPGKTTRLIEPRAAAR
jgi:phenylacetate-CoA ligase